MSNDDRLTVDDVIRAGGCPAGIRRWFTARRENLPVGVTLRTFINSGMSIEEARSCQDAFIDRALALKEQRSGR